MAGKDAVLVTSALDKTEIQDSVSSIVKIIENGVNQMADKFDGGLSRMQKSLSDFSTTAKTKTISANRELASSFDTVGEAIKRAKEVGIGSFGGFNSKGVFKSEKEALQEFNQAFKASVDKAKAEQERLEQIMAKGRESAVQSMRPRERWDVRQDSEIEQTRMKINALQRDLKALDSTNLKMQEQAWDALSGKIWNAEMQIAKYKKEQERLKTTPVSNEHEQRALTQQYEALNQKIAETRANIEKLKQEQLKVAETDFVSVRRNELTQQLEQARNQYHQMGVEMERVAQEEQQLTQATQQNANSQAKVTDEIKKQAQAIRESKQFQEKGYIFLPASDGSSKTWVVSAQKKKTIEEQLLEIEKEQSAEIAKQEKERQKALAQQQQQTQAAQQQEQVESRITATINSRTDKPMTFSSYESLQDAIAHVLKVQRDRVKIADEESASSNRLNKTLKQLTSAYYELSASERASEQGKNLADQIQRTSRAIREIQTQMNRPVSLKAALGLDANTIDQITYKIQQLNAYKRGINLFDPKQAGEIKQVDEAVKKLQDDLNKLIGTNNRLQNSNNALARSWNYMKNRLAFYFTVGASTQFVKQIIDIRSQYELAEKSLGTLINSAERGSQIFSQLSDMSLVSPYTLIELSNAAKQLVAYDVAARDVADTTRRLADISAAVGIPMERMTYALGQIKAYGYLNSRDARMFANAGIPLVKQLSDYYTELEGRMVSIGDIYDQIKKKAISYNDVMSVINKMTDEGGKFFDFQAKMAETPKVQLANLTLAWNNMINSIGESDQGIIVFFIKGLKDIFLQWQNINRVIISFGATFVIFKGLQLLMLGLYQKSEIVRNAFKKANREISMTGIVGEKTAKKLQTLGSAFKSLFSVQTGFWLIVSAIIDMIMTVRQADAAVKELNQSIASGAKESLNNLTEAISSYASIEKSLYNWGKDDKGNEIAISSRQIDTSEAEKAWNGIKEEIYNSSSAANFFVGKLEAITDSSERLRQAFNLVDNIKTAQGALQNLDEDSIQVTQEWSKWWNLWLAKDGLIENIKDYSKILKDTKSDAGDVAIAYSKMANDINVTAKSMSLAFQSLSGVQAREAFESTISKVLEGKGLDKQGEIKARIELERQYYDETTKLYKEQIGAQLELGKQAAADQIAQSLVMWQRGFGQRGELANAFFQYLKTMHASDLKKMFGNMTREEINHIDWSESKWQEWAKKNAEEFSKQYHVSFNDLWNLVKEANTWKINIGVVLDTTSLQKSIYETLTSLDAKANSEYERIKRLVERREQLKDELKTPLSLDDRMKKNEELNRLNNELKVSQDEYNKAVAAGGKSKKEEADARKEAAAARKRETAAARAQRAAETELQKALKDELSLIDKVRGQYKKLNDAGVDNTTALTMVTNQFENSIANINKILGKNGLPLFDIKKFAGTDNPNAILQMLDKQLQAAKNAKNVKPVEIKDLEVKIGELKVDAKVYNMKKVTDGLNNELSKIKDEYELAVAIEAMPELGDIFGDLFNIDTSKLTTNIQDVINRYQNATDTALDDAFFGENAIADPTKGIYKSFNLLTDDLSQWANMTGIKVGSDLYKALESKQKELRDMVEKYKTDIIKQAKDLEYKLADNAGKIAIEEEKLAKLRKDLEKEVDKDKRRLLELQIQDQINNINKLKETILSELPVYKRLFDGIVEHSTRVTRQLAENYKKALDVAKAKGKNQDGNYTVVDPETGEKAEISAEKLNKEYDKVNKKFLETQSIFGKIKEAFTKGEDGIIDWWKGIELVAGEAKKLAEIVSEIGNIAQQLGASEDTTEIINDIATSIEGVSEAAMGLVQIQSGDIIGGSLNVIKGLWKTVSTWFDNGNKKIDRKVKASERMVKQLENAYKDLEYAVKESLGSAEITARKAAIANKQLQLAELERQLQLEQSRKKKNQDKDKITDLQGQIIDARNELKDMTNDITNTILGSDIKSAAEDFVSTWVSAWRQGEDVMESLTDKFDDMIDNMIMKSIASKLVAQRLKPIYDIIETISGNESDTEMLSKLNKIKDFIGNGGFATGINDVLEMIYGYLGIGFGSANKDKSLSALQQGIQGITEDTASALEAYMNGVSQQVYYQSQILTEIRDAVVMIDGNVQLSTQAQMLLQLQQSYAVQMAIQNILLGWSNASGMAVKVEMV